MSELAKNAWALFIIFLVCGVWTPLVVLVVVGVFTLIHWKWPWLIKKD